MPALKKIFLLLFLKISISCNAGILTEARSFGTNKGNLRLYYYKPKNAGPKATLVVVLHGCNQDADIVAKQTGWNKLADLYGFVMLYPEQKRINNPSNCFNWFNNSDIEKEAGEAASIKEMIDYMILNFKTSANDVFVTGLSAGAAMSVALMAVYPETFKGGAIAAGGPYKSATDLFESLRAMRGKVSYSPQDWGNLVREQHKIKPKSYPSMLIIHGKNDMVVNPDNAIQLIKQWTNVLNIDDKEDSIIYNFAGAKDVTKHIYSNKNKKDLVVFYEIDHLNHALPIDPGICRNQGGRIDIFSKDKGFHSTYWIADFFGIIPPSKIKIEKHFENTYILSVPYYSSSKYKWTVTEPAKIIEGQGTSKIKISINPKSICNVNVVESDSICTYNYESLILK